MIITGKKTSEEILESIKNAGIKGAGIKDVGGIFVVGCGSCASKIGTGGEDAVAEMLEFLKKNGIEVSGSAILESGCDIRLVKKDLIKNEAFKKAFAALTLTCGAGSQAVSAVSEKTVIPALNSDFVGTMERIGVYKKFCGICGDCILIETQGLCPRTRCPKSLVNGPCGGFVNGKCETDQSKDCVWVLIYEKLKKNGKIDKFLEQYIEPKKTDNR